MVKSGSFLAVFLIFSSCLEQDLDLLSLSEAERLLTAGSSKSWRTPDNQYELQLDELSQGFLLKDGAGDSISYGTWSVTEDIRGSFTDSLLLAQTKIDPSSPLTEVNIVVFLTSEFLSLQSEDQILRFTNSPAF